MTIHRQHYRIPYNTQPSIMTERRVPLKIILTSAPLELIHIQGAPDWKADFCLKKKMPKKLLSAENGEKW